MRTQIKFANFATAVAAVLAASSPGQAPISTVDAQHKVLSQAINFELAKPQMAWDICREDTVRVCKQFSRVPGDKREVVVSVDSIKAYLARKYATTSTNPILNDPSNDIAQYFHTNMPEMDTAWMALFDFVDLRGTSHDHFDIIDTNMGVVFEQISQGGEIKPRRAVSEAKTIVPMVTYGAGIGILDEWIEDQKFWNIDEAVAEFHSNHYDNMARIHYGLFTAQSSGINVAFSTDDTITFNAAAAAMFRGLRTSGKAPAANAGLYIVCAPEKTGRILKMLEATQGSHMVAMGANKEPIAFHVRGVISTTWVSAADTGYYLILPGRKNKRGVKRDLSIEPARNAHQMANDIVASTRFNGAVGDVTQVRRVLYS